MKFYEERIESKRVFEGKMISVRVDHVRLPDGKVSTREVVDHPGAVVIVPVLGEKILFVEQYRYPIEQVLLELPAGKMDPAESPEECAERELEEETGYRAKKLSYLGKIFTTPGFTTEVIHIFAAEDLEKTTQNTDPDEFIEVKELHIEEVLSLLRNAEIEDSKTICALTRFFFAKGVIR
ncbi:MULTISPECIES: NUDIX hydrolase [unclassified Thermotoga]|uniref:NUDIX domain-containing protein n=1 Tax=unclassified Thermotoga TaxID=2631113 RepID=UPI000541BADD|nr:MULTISPECIES: NUDIX hydrolase [unclassified Thermotoga]KAF2960181.1 ADP-ribose pyrophosphatase [Thermotoga sp. 38H-to]KHC91525.1 NUDIX hydrolase [Thermotoga sp. Mc24]